ncbi:Ubiquinone biosynthesis protein [[Candida] zeylanoides]
MLTSIKGRCAAAAFCFRPSVRCYHSVDHPTSIVNPNTIETKILDHSLQHVPKYGFNSYCITKSLHELKYPDSAHSILTANPDGKSLEFQMVMHWLKSQRQKLHSHVLDPQSPFHALTDEYQRINYLIATRLQYNEPIIHKLSYGLSQLVTPYNMAQSMEELHNLSDDIVFYAGDESNDFAWYTKRGSVSSIYVASELYMVSDASSGFRDTKRFVEDKVRHMQSLGDAYNDVEQWGAFNAIGLVNLVKSQWLRG